MLFCGVELPSSYAELNAVFDMYDVTLSGHINYRELVKTVDRQVHASSAYNSKLLSLSLVMESSKNFTTALIVRHVIVLTKFSAFM